MSLHDTKYVVRGQGGSLEAVKSTKPTINTRTEILIRLKAIAINPADCKMIYQGHRITSWPLVPGMDGAGFVEAVGEDVKRFRPGDEVLAMFSPGDRGASYQDYAVVEESMVAAKPTNWSFEDAATISVCYCTGIAALGIGLKTPLPFLKDGPTTGFVPESVLVLGGSSALGAATIQLLHYAMPNCKVLTTSSPKHHTHIIDTLGADKVFDRSSPTLIEDIKSNTSSSRGVDAIIDTVGAARNERHIFDAFNPQGPKKYAQVWTGDDEIEVPHSIESVMFRARDLSKMQGGGNVMSALQSLLKEEKYNLPLKVHKVGQGLAGLQKGLEMMLRGVSGEKLVVTL